MIFNEEIRHFSSIERRRTYSILEYTFRPDLNKNHSLYGYKNLSTIGRKIHFEFDGMKKEKTRPRKLGTKCQILIY